MTPTQGEWGWCAFPAYLDRPATTLGLGLSPQSAPICPHYPLGSQLLPGDTIPYPPCPPQPAFRCQRFWGRMRRSSGGPWRQPATSSSRHQVRLVGSFQTFYVVIGHWCVGSRPHLVTTLGVFMWGVITVCHWALMCMAAASHIVVTTLDVFLWLWCMGGPGLCGVLVC